MKIALIEDHGIVREGLKALLKNYPWIEVVAEAGTGKEALVLADTCQIDCMVMDIAMPDLNGIEATQHILEKHPQIQIVILSVYATAEHIYRAFSAGAIGYVLKESAGKELVEAIRSAQYNRRYLSELIRNNLPDIFDDLGKKNSPLDRLSTRERQILQLVVEGKSSALIARELLLSAKTIETYRSRLMTKLQLQDIPSLVKFAIQHGLTPL